MAQCHLAHKIPWKNLRDCLIGDKTQIDLPIGDCERIHCHDRATEIKVRNRKYIHPEQICQDEGCKTVGNGSFSKNKSSEPQIRANNKLNNKQKKKLKYFCEQFTKTVFEFGQSESKREDELSHSYLNNCDLDVFVNTEIPCTECYGHCHGPFCKNFVVFNLIITGRIKTLLKLHELKRVDINAALSETYGGQAVGNGFSFLNYHIFGFYLLANAIVACGYENDSSKWAGLNPKSGYLFRFIQDDCDYKTFIPSLRHLLQPDIFLKDQKSTHLLLKECFRFIYQYVNLKTIFYDYTAENFYDDILNEVKYTFYLHD